MSSIDVEAVDSVEDESEESEGHTHDSPSDIEVQATGSGLPEGVDAPEYVLYGGKGGVGKTTMAAATALASAAGGVSTLVVSTDPAHSLSDTLDAAIPPRPTQIREDMPLYAAEIDPDEAVGEGMFGGAGEDGGVGGENPLGGMGQMGEMFGDDEMGGMNPMMGGTMPGADEAAAMRQLLEYLDDPRFDRVVVDTAPTGHTLRLLQLPEMMDSMVGRMMKLRQQFSGMMEGVKGMFGGGSDDAPGMGDLDELQERIEHLRTVLQDPEKTDFRVVMIPEEMSVVESERLVNRLGEFDIPVQTLVVNRVMENLGDVADVDPEWVVSPNLEDCDFCQRRWQVQQNALKQSMELFRGRDVKRVPLLADEVQGEEALRVVAACLD
jgi:arsenite-transporting ATPase